MLLAPQPGRCHPSSTDCGSSLFAYRHSCLSYCPPRYYGRIQRSATNAARVCASCHPSCYTCWGASANNCTACPPAGTFDELTRSCSPPQGFPAEEGLQSDLLPVLVCGTLILSAFLYVTYRVAFCITKGSSCCPQAGRAE